jgi:hypothetical protein
MRLFGGTGWVERMDGVNPSPCPLHHNQVYDQHQKNLKSRIRTIWNNLESDPKSTIDVPGSKTPGMQCNGVASDESRRRPNCPS